MNTSKYFDIDWADVGIDDLNNYCVFNEYSEDTITLIIDNIKNENIKGVFKNNSEDRILLVTNGSASIHQDDIDGVFISATTALFVVDCDENMVLEIFPPNTLESDVEDGLIGEGEYLKIPLEKDKFIIFNSNQLHRLQAEDGAKSILLNATINTIGIANIISNSQPLKTKNLKSNI